MSAPDRVRSATRAHGAAAHRVRGAAIISALLVVALATSVVATLFLRMSVTTRSVENRLALSQVRWIERAAVDWAKVILRSDGMASAVDHLGEPWAVPVAETRLDETVTAGARIGDDSRPGSLTGQMIDMQGRLNLVAILGTGQVSAPHLAAARQLFALLDLPDSLVDTVLARLMRSQPRVVEGRSLPAAASPLVRLDDLLALPGFDPSIVARLEPFVTVIPFVAGAPLPSLVNLNTAPAEVIAALVPGLELSGARRFVERRERSVFRSLEEASQQMNGQPVLSPLLTGVGSSYFLLRGMVRFDRVEVVSETLLSRASGKIEIVWQQRL